MSPRVAVLGAVAAVGPDEVQTGSVAVQAVLARPGHAVGPAVQGKRVLLPRGARTHVGEVQHAGHGVGSERKGIGAEHNLDVVHAQEGKVKPVVRSALHVVVAPTLEGRDHAVATESAQNGFDGVPAHAGELKRRCLTAELKHG